MQCTQRGIDIDNQAKTSALIPDFTIGAVAMATYLFVRSPRTSSTTTTGIQVAREVGPGMALRGVW